MPETHAERTEQPVQNERTESDARLRLEEESLDLRSTSNSRRKSASPDNSGAPAALAAENPAKPNKPADKEWTIAIELGATLPGDKDSPSGFGAESKNKMLKQLASETEGKPVNFVVAAELTTDSKGKPCVDENTPRPPESARACMQDAVKKHRAKTESYFIHDGKIDKLPEQGRKNAETRLANLLKQAQELSPSAKLGLIIQSHGTGASGIETNRGALPLANMVNGIKEGLQSGGRDKLDFINFDACSMSTVPVLDSTSKISRNVVASAAVESARQAAAHGDGQNLQAALRMVLNNPALSGKELSASMVDLIKDGATGRGKENTISTLASFDTSKYEPFKQSLNKLGQQLSIAATDGNNMSAIRAAIDGSIRPQSGAPETNSQERDLGSFAENIRKSIESGKLKDSSGEIRTAAEEFIKNLDALTTNRFGEKSMSYQNLAQLTAGIPGAEVLDRKETGRLNSPLHQFKQQLNELLTGGMKMEDRGDVLKQLSPFREIYPLLSRQADRPDKRLDAIRKEAAAAQSLPQLENSLKKMIAEFEKIENSAIGKRLAAQAEKSSSTVRREYRAMRPPAVTPGWEAFIKQLERSGNL